MEVVLNSNGGFSSTYSGGLYSCLQTSHKLDFWHIIQLK